MSEDKIIKSQIVQLETQLSNLRKVEQIHKQRWAYLGNVKFLTEMQKETVEEKFQLGFYLLTFFKIELQIILAIDINITTTGEKKYSTDFIRRITSGKLRFSELINIFCLLYGDVLLKELKSVNHDRNDMIHEFIKKQQNKESLEKYIRKICNNCGKLDKKLSILLRKEVVRARIKK